MRVARLEHGLNRHLFRHPAVIAQIVFHRKDIPVDLKLVCTEIAMTFTRLIAGGWVVLALFHIGVQMRYLRPLI